jgi:hypothetical protein
MDIDSLSPMSRALLEQALPGGLLENVLYRDGARLETGFLRERRCFALGERGWLAFMGWEGHPDRGADYVARWALTDQAQALLAA